MGKPERGEIEAGGLPAWSGPVFQEGFEGWWLEISLGSH
jgi:hypothetical protein